MKILVGICGIGNGHINRQASVIDLLLKNGHEIVVATTNNNVDYLKNLFNNIKIVEISIPWIVCNSNGLDFNETLHKYCQNKVDYFENLLKLSIEIEKYFKAKPDIVISDYEPNVAQYSYAADIPLICMEQQSKYLYMKEIKMDNFSIQEEKSRLGYFFPKYNYKIISSFFPIKIKEKKIVVVPPIISKLRKLEKKENHILVYFSPYGKSEKYEKILDALKKIKSYNYIVYTKEKIQIKENNIVIKQFSDNFKNDLENSACIITTAGHQLLSEAISIDIPLYIIPLDTYEQNYNAIMIEKYNLGKIGKKFDSIELQNFIIKKDDYSKNIRKFRKKQYYYSWEDKFIDVISKIGVIDE